MPGHIVHAYVDQKIFGKAYWKIHRYMDLPVLWLGKDHRRLYHDYLSATIFARTLYPGDRNAEEAAMAHILLDQLCSANKAWAVQLKYLAYADRRRRKARRENRTRKRRPQASQEKERIIIGQLINYFGCVVPHSKKSP
jgi:hypothetical protein